MIVFKSVFPSAFFVVDYSEMFACDAVPWNFPFSRSPLSCHFRVFQHFCDYSIERVRGQGFTRLSRLPIFTNKMPCSVEQTECDENHIVGHSTRRFHHAPNFVSSSSFQIHWSLRSRWPASRFDRGKQNNLAQLVWIFWFSFVFLLFLWNFYF